MSKNTEQKNKKTTWKNTTLAIEAGVGGGSLAVWRNGLLLDSWSGGGEQSGSKTFEIFEQAEKLLTANKIEKNIIGQIVVSKGPGSYTGLRKGWAAALGLARSLQCAFTSVSVLEALSLLAADDLREAAVVVTAVPFGKMQICRQEFELSKYARTIKLSSVPLVSQKQEFIEEAASSKFGQLILHGSLYAEVQRQSLSERFETENLIDAGENLAVLLCEYQERHASLSSEKPLGNRTVRPLYISENKF